MKNAVKEYSSKIPGVRKDTCWTFHRQMNVPAHAYIVMPKCGVSTRTHTRTKPSRDFLGWGRKPFEYNHEDWMIVYDAKREDENIEIEFKKLADNWKRQTGGLSNLNHITRNENYLKIIGMGRDALPFILRDLQETYDYWFFALQAISRVNPVPDEDFGNIERMTTHWLNWGKKRNII